MLFRTLSAAVYGIDADLVDIEVNLTPVRGDSDQSPPVTIVGLPDAAVRESRERIRAAIQNCGHFFPFQKTTINLAPADVRKEGASFDLPGPNAGCKVTRDSFSESFRPYNHAQALRTPVCCSGVYFSTVFVFRPFPVWLFSSSPVPPTPSGVPFVSEEIVSSSTPTAFAAVFACCRCSRSFGKVSWT